MVPPPLPSYKDDMGSFSYNVLYCLGKVPKTFIPNGAKLRLPSRRSGPYEPRLVAREGGFLGSSQLILPFDIDLGCLLVGILGA